MKEVVLQYIWEKQLFKKHNLQTTAGASLQVIASGKLNNGQGPDFSEAVLQIGGIIFSGSVEIHLRSSDWIRHQHRYTNVILHVVLIHDQDLLDESGYLLPVLALSERLLNRYIPNFQQLIADWAEINCKGYFQKEHESVAVEVLRVAGIQRLNDMKSQLCHQLNRLDGDIELLAKWIFFKTIGQPYNSVAMEELFFQMPWKSLARKQLKEHEWLVILRGISGLLNTLTKDEIASQNQEFEYWKCLLRLQPLKVDSWKTGKIRPAQHPEKRLQFLALVLSKNSSISQLLLQKAEALDKRQATVNPTGLDWERTTLGRAILVNAVVPFHSFYLDRAHYVEGAAYANGVLWERLPSEDNRYTRIFKDAGFNIDNALKSQGVIQHYRYQCHPGNCMKCNIAARILQTLPG